MACKDELAATKAELGACEEALKERDTLVSKLKKHIEFQEEELSETTDDLWRAKEAAKGKAVNKAAA